MLLGYLKLKRFVIITFTLLSTLMANAQVQVEAKIDSIAIFIGQQTQMVVNVTAKRNSRIQFPTFQRSQYITPGVEVLCSAPADTSMTDNDMMTVSKSFTLTSFDEKLYAIPGMKVKVDGKEYQANQLALKVVTLDVDTLHPNQFFPPKDVQDNPFDWKEWAPAFWLSLVVLILCVVFVYLVIRLKQNKPIVMHIKVIKIEPPHKKALNAIDKLRSERTTSADDQKTYYTQLTDVIRQYIADRFGFNAKEMTSSEILFRLKENGDQKMIDELKELFTTADLVKFAKYSTLLNENDLNLVNAVKFIDQTKIEGKTTEERVVPKLSENDIKSRTNRVYIKTAMVVFGALIIIIVGYVIYHICLLME